MAVNAESSDDAASETNLASKPQSAHTSTT
jgi:hypothetical protein